MKRISQMGGTNAANSNTAAKPIYNISMPKNIYTIGDRKMPASNK